MELTLFATITDFKPEYTTELKGINLVWMEHYKSKGDAYASLLENPDTAILSHGGKIFVAFVENELVGTCVLLRKSVKRYEICLMAVKPDYQGKNIGKQLLSAAIDAARQLDAKTIELITNPKLAAAIDLYKTHGFHELKDFEANSILFDENDIKMEMALM